MIPTRMARRRARTAPAPAPAPRTLQPVDWPARWRTLDPWTLPPVIAGRSLIADTVAQIPFVAVRDGRVLARQPAILRRPDPTEPRWSTVARIVNDLTGAGVAWLMVTARDANDRWPTAIRVLPARECRPELDNYGRPAAVVWTPPTGGPRTLRVGRDVYHVPNLLDVDHVGRSPIAAAFTALEGVAAAYETEISFWLESGVPPFVIQSRYQLTNDQTTALQDQWTAARARTGKPAVLTGDVELHELAGSAPTLFRDAHETGIATVARILRIPPVLLNARAGDSLTYSTTEGQFRSWLVTGLAAYLVRLEGVLSDLLPSAVTVRADTADLLRTDTPSRFAAYTAALGGAQWLTVDEVRAMEGRGPLNDTAANMPAPVTDPTVTGA